MNRGQTVFAQLLHLFPITIFIDSCIAITGIGASAIFPVGSSSWRWLLPS